MKNEELTNRFERLLFELRLHQQEFAEKINVSRATVGRVLRGDTLPSGSFLNAVQAAFPNVNYQWLLSGEGEMFKKVEAPAPVLSKTVVTEEGNLLDEIRGMREDFKRLMAVIESQAELLKKRTGNSKKRAGKVLELGLPLGYLAA